MKRTGTLPVLGRSRLHINAGLLLLAWMLTATQSRAATIFWSGAGGDDSWSNPANWTGGVLPGGDDDVVINVPGEMTVRMDTPATVRSLQCQESFLLEYGPFTVTAGASFVNGSFNMNPVQALIAEGPTTTFTAHGVVTNLAGVGASGGAVISFPNARQVEAIVWAFSTTAATRWSASGSGSVIEMVNLTNLVGVGSTYRGYDLLNATDGGRIDLHQLRSTEGDIGVGAANPASVIDLSGLEGLWPPGPSVFGLNSRLSASDGGTILIPNVTALDRVNLNLSDSGNIPTAQLRSFTDGTLSLSSRTNGFTGLTNFSGSISAYDSRLDWTNFTVLYATNTSTFSISANQRSVIDLSRVTNVVANPAYGMNVSASTGSRIDLCGLRQPDGGLYAYVSAYSAGSLVDLSGLTGLWAGNNSSVRVDDGGTVLIPNVTAMNKVTLTLSHDAVVPTAQIRSFTDGYITLSSRTNDFAGLTNFSGYCVVSDTRLALTNLIVLYATNNSVYFQAEQGSFIDLSRLTNVVTSSSGYDLAAYANGGSRIDLHRLRVPEGPLNVSANGADSLVDLSGFSGLWPAHDSIVVRASSGATVAIQNVTAMRGISLDLSYDANAPMAQLCSFTEGGVRLQSQTNVFTALTNFASYLDCGYLGRAEFPNLTQLNTASNPVGFTASSGGAIDLSQVTNAVVETYSLTLYAYYGGRIELPNLESIVAGAVNVTAEGTDAVVDLSGLTGFFSDNNSGSLRTISGGAILLNSDAMLLAGVAIDFQSNPGGPLPPFLAPSQSLVLYGQPWRSYRIESRNPSVTDSPWSLYRRVPLTGPLQTVSARPPKDLVLRVRTFIANPPEVDIRRAAPGFAEAVLYGVPGRTYRLETTTALGAGGWQDGPTVTLTNSFSIFPTGTTNGARFYQGRQL